MIKAKQTSLDTKKTLLFRSVPANTVSSTEKIVDAGGAKIHRTRPSRSTSAENLKVHAEYLHSCGATTLTFIVDGVNAVSSFIVLSKIHWNMVVAPDNTTLTYNSLRRQKSIRSFQGRGELRNVRVHDADIMKPCHNVRWCGNWHTAVKTWALFTQPLSCRAPPAMSSHCRS